MVDDDEGGYRPLCRARPRQGLGRHAPDAADRYGRRDQHGRAGRCHRRGRGSRLPWQFRRDGRSPAIERDPNSPLLAALKRAADDVTDADTTVGFFTGCTDTAVIAGKTGNRNCMSYGPGSLVLAHKPNEPGPMPISFAARTCSTRLLTTRSGTQASKLGHNKPRTNRLAR